MGFADLWKQASEEDWEPPVGTYKVRVADADSFVSRAGAEFAKVRLEVTDGGFKGNSWDHLMGFGSAVAARISHGHLAMYGVDVDAITDFYELKEAMPNLIGVTAEVSVKHNNGFINTDVLRVFTGESDVPADAAAFQHTPADADDEPLPY
jgi:hypothetical protein